MVDIIKIPPVYETDGLSYSYGVKLRLRWHLPIFNIQLLFFVYGSHKFNIERKS